MLDPASVTSALTHCPKSPHFPAPPPPLQPQNPAASIQWIALGNYRLPKFCQAFWLGVPECSLCTVVPKDPQVPKHHRKV